MRDADICRKLFFIAIKDKRNKDLTVKQIKEKLLAFFDAKIVEEAMDLEKGYNYRGYLNSDITFTPNTNPINTHVAHTLTPNTILTHTYTKSSTN